MKQFHVLVKQFHGATLVLGMVVSAKHFSEVTNGYQQTTDGLWVHRGNVMAKGSYFDVGAVRVNANMAPTPNTGKGLEILYDVPSNTSYLQSMDRDASVYRPLTINASTVNLPDGSIGTSELATGAAQAMVGQYTAGISWSTPSINTWHETPMQVNATVSGAIVRVEITLVVSNTVPSAITYIGFGSNGAVALGLTAFNCITASYVVPMTAVYYFTPPAGTYRYAVFMYTNSGVSSIWNGVNAALYMTEQRR